MRFIRQIVKKHLQVYYKWHQSAKRQQTISFGLLQSDFQLTHYDSNLNIFEAHKVSFYLIEKLRPTLMVLVDLIQLCRRAARYSYFESNKRAPTQTANRLQLQATILLSCNFKIEYCRTSRLGQVDAFSRFISKHAPSNEGVDTHRSSLT